MLNVTLLEMGLYPERRENYSALLVFVNQPLD